MGRTHVQTKLCFNVVVLVNSVEVHNKNYTTLKEVAKDLNLSYTRVADLNIGRSKMCQGEFKFLPIVSINKITIV